MRPLALLIALALALTARADDVDPEPRPDRAKSLEKIANTMGDLAKRLKDGSVGDEAQRLQKRVLAQIDEALRREKAGKAPEGRAVAANLEMVRAMQARLGRSVERVARLGEGVEGRSAELTQLSEYQAKAAQILRDIAAQCKPAR